MTEEKELPDDDSAHRLENKMIPPRSAAAIQAAKAAAAATGARVSETRKASRER